VGPTPSLGTVKALKIGFLTLAVIYLLYHAANLPNYDLLDNVNLIIHEAGHLLFAIFGEFISFTGGTFFQLLIPILFIIYFLKKDLYSASVVSLWLAHSLINVSVYVSDAIEMKLPLLGGGIHDWNYMLSKLNLLPLAPFIGSAILFLAIAIMIISFVSGIISVVYDKKILFV
jgi:hypothetical protein